MTGQIKKEYIQLMQSRYKKARTRKEKSTLIKEMVANLQIHEKSAIRVLNAKPRRRAPRHKGKPILYADNLITPLRLLWQVAGYPCSKRLQPQLGCLIDKLLQFHELKLCDNQERLLRQIKPSSIDRLLAGEKDLSKKEFGLSGTKRSPLLKTLIPIRTQFSYQEYKDPGHTEMDCVLHCGESLTGSYAETLNILDIATHWNEKKIFLKKNKRKIIGAFHELRTKQFPFPILSADFDNGGEFVNWTLKGYCDRHAISFTRCRSYHKNDQAHIEGKNYQSIRRVVGYSRITHQQIVDAIDNLYQGEHRLLTNFFFTTMKLKEKRKEGGKVTKVHEQAKTPYQRVMASDIILPEIKEKLRVQYQLLNPAELSRSMQTKLNHIRILIAKQTDSHG